MGKFMGVNAPEGGEEAREEAEEESDSEDSDLTRGARDEVVKLALGFLRNMNQDEIAENVHSSKSLVFPPDILNMVFNIVCMLYLMFEDLYR